MKRKFPAFFSGVLVTILVAALCVTVLAASGKLTYNAVNIAVFGQQKIAADATIAAANGQKIPASIGYVDEIGGTTNYLPIRTISELLDASISWDAEKNTVALGGTQPPAEPIALVVGDTIITMGGGMNVPTPGKVALPFTMIDEKKPAGTFETILPEARYQAKGFFTQTLHCDRSKGQYVTVTMVNNNPSAAQTLALVFYREKTVGEDIYFRSLIIGPGKSVSRTFEIDESANCLTDKLGFTVSYNTAAAPDYKLDVTANAIQFN